MKLGYSISELSYADHRIFINYSDSVLCIFSYKE